MREINVDIVEGFSDSQKKKPIYKTVREKIYTIEELPMLGKLLSCKDSQKRNVNYLNIPCAFDIETTNIYQKDSEGNILKDPYPYAFMYHWQFCLDDCVCFGRTWPEFMRLLSELEKRMNLSFNNRLVIYVHNLPFEWAFMNRFINYEDGFFREERKPLKILTSEGIEFRCSYALSNMSLNKFCQNEEGVKHYKLSGEDFDYGKIRTPETKLTEAEEAYCYNDVRGLCECIESRLKHDTLSTIPMTSTGYVRRDLRASVKGDKKYRRLFKDNALNEDLYKLCREAFRGGNTHANVDYSRQLLHDVTSKDIASSYPASMMMDLYPQTAFFKVNVSTYLNRDMSEYALLMEVRFVNIEYIGKSGIPYIAFTKCRNYGLYKKKEYREHRTIDNGRVLKSDLLEMVITDIDLEIIKRDYKFDDIFIKNIYASTYGPLSDSIKNVIMSYFRSKTLLKGDQDHEYEYNKDKALLNSSYGCMVMRIDQEMIRYNPSTYEYLPEEADLEETLAKFYKSRNNFLSYQHGLWITCHSRARLQRMLDTVGEDVVYCDTDSIKYKGDHEKEFEDINKTLKEEAIRAGAFAPDKDGNIKYMGVWEDDGHYEEFKTLGAKKYVYKQKVKNKETGEDEIKIVSTIAGVNKKAGSEFFKENGLQSFDIGTKIINSGHLTAFYNDSPIKEIEVNGCKFLTASNVALIDNSYTVGVTGEYLDLLEKALAKQEDMDYI